MEKLELLNIASLQRQKLKGEYEKPGWNIWALSGAFASAIWLFISFLEEKQFDIHEAMIFFMLFFVSFTTLRPILKDLFNPPATGLHSRYNYSRNFLSTSKVGVLFHLATWVLIYFYSIKTIDLHPAFIKYMFHGFFIYTLLGFVSFLIFAFYNLPIASVVSNKKQQGINIVIYSVSVILIISVFAV